MEQGVSQGLLDSVWVLLSSFLVFFMHSGFALVESGFCRKKNAVMVLLKNVAVVGIGSIVYYLVGYGVMFGSGNPFLGLSGFMPNGSEPDVGTLPVFVFLFFQLVFAATACTIVSGAVAERARLGTFFLFCVAAVAFIYPVVGHWIWGGGWLAGIGFKDFAGSAAVHAVGGGMALAGVLAVGPRLGKYDENGQSRPMPAHNFPLAALGVLVLWLGWFGFNGGSTVSAANPGAIGRIVLVTNLSASAGFLVALGWVRLRTKMLDFSMALNGALAGLVGITAGCDVIGPGWSLLVGSIAAVLCVEAVFFMDKRKIDDPVGAVAVHGVCGLFGTLAVGLFADEIGLFTGGGAAQLGTQAIGALSAFGFAFVTGAAVWFGMKALPGGIRVSKEHELDGMDVAECGVQAYADDAPLGMGHVVPREQVDVPVAAE
jgi:Amt family ammonium transporter